MKYIFEDGEIEIRTGNKPVPTISRRKENLAESGMKSVMGWREFPKEAGVAIQCPLCGKIKSPAFPAEHDGWLQCDGCGMIGHIMAPKRLQMNESRTAFIGPWNFMGYYQDSDGPVKVEDFTLERFLDRFTRLHGTEPGNLINYLFGIED